MPQMTTVRESISEGSPVLRRSRRKKNGRVLRGIGRWIGRVFALIGTFFLIFALFVVGVVCVICKGPSKAASEVFVNSVMESSAAKFIAYIFYSDEEVEAILNKYS
ncbi:MAG: hypothetical protein II348_01395, partial [Clostridia bacterium]|nr:hypothetical protein [Clostridia bacterium]